MKYSPHKHHRRSIRLKGYDYTQPGAYFVTICTQNRECVLGEIVEGVMHVSPFGQIAYDFWAEVSVHFPHVNAASYIIMPNHVHAMIVIRDIPLAAESGAWKPRPYHCTGVVSTAGSTPGSTPGSTAHLGQGDLGQGDPGQGDPAPTGDNHVTTGGRPDLGQIVAFYKYQTTKRINAQNNNPGRRFWQRNYYEHIVRNDDEYRHIIDYIQSNPLRWEADQLHPAAAPNRFNQE